MYASNLLELLPSELISFILKYLPAQDLENCHSINDIWKSEANLELTKRINNSHGFSIWEIGSR